MPSTRYSLINEIKQHDLYRRTSGRDKRARDIIESQCADVKSSKSRILPGQLVLFKYLNPKTREELEYYDASPCTIFFGIVNTSEGRRVLGFNIHYFPPALRFRIMDKIYDLFRPVYQKYFTTGVSKEMDAFDYKFLIDELKKQNMSFAVRMYIPSLIGDTQVIPPKEWPTAMFTEGWFKKDTRAHIMSLFKQDAKSRGKISTGAHSKGKAAKR